MNFINAEDFCGIFNLHSRNIFLGANSRLELSSCNHYHYIKENNDYTVIELINGGHKSLSLRVTAVNSDNINNKISFSGIVVSFGGFGFRKGETTLKVNQLLEIEISSEKVNDGKTNLFEPPVRQIE